MASGLNSQFKKYQHKRFVALSSIAFMVTTLFVFAFVTFYIYPNNPWLQSLLLVTLIIAMIIFLWFKQYMMIISMYLHYFRMIDDNMPMFSADLLPYDAMFETTLLNKGYFVGVKKNAYTIYYQYLDKLPYVQRTGPTWVVIIQTFLPGLSVQNEGIEQEISYLKSTKIFKKPIQNELTIILKKFDTFEPSAKDELDEIINFSLVNRAVITLQLGEFNNRSLYMLRPKKLYPNKYYYALVRLVYDLIKVREKL